MVKMEILLITLKFNGSDIEKKDEKFHDTGDFEVYCFCPILKIDKKEMLDLLKKLTLNIF